jgi:hypothetical protein
MSELAEAQPYRARQGVQNGEVRSLDQILNGIRRERPGNLADVQGPEAGPSGEPHYRLKWVTPDGRVQWLDTDARTGRVLGVQGDERPGPGGIPRGNFPPRGNFAPRPERFAPRGEFAGPPNGPPPGAERAPDPRFRGPPAGPPRGPFIPGGRFERGAPRFEGPPPARNPEPGAGRERGFGRFGR